MARRKKKCYSGIGGQAVLEGIMMKNKEKYAIAVRNADGGITVEVENHQGLLHDSGLKKLPFVRGVFNFADSLVLGMKCLNYSAAVSERTEGKEEEGKAAGGGGKLAEAAVTILSIALALGLFLALPYYLASYFKGYVQNASLMSMIEGGVRIAIFVLYVWGISFMKDIRRLYRYHGAEHKCINCIERGRPLTLRNVMRSSRLHKRCGTSFIFFVMLVSIVLFSFIRAEQPLQRMALRLLLLPVVAGISYELIWLAGRSDNILVRILSIPGMLVQRLTTKEPDREMAKVAIAAVEAVFDWKIFLCDHFGYEGDGSGEDGTEAEDDGAEAEDDEAGTGAGGADGEKDRITADEGENGVQKAGMPI